MSGATSILPITAGGAVVGMGTTAGVLFALGVTKGAAVNFALASGLLLTSAALAAAALGLGGSLLLTLRAHRPIGASIPANDGREGFRPDGRSAATRIPPAFGLAGVNLATYTGWGTVTYWNAFVANLEMHGQGNFFDPRLDDATRFPVAAKARFGHGHNIRDLITSKLGALHAYELSLAAPTPPKDTFDPAAAARGQ
jgi:hypothetical protein